MSARSGRTPTHEPQRRRRLSLPAARGAPPMSSPTFPQLGPSPLSLSPYASCPLPHLIRDLAGQPTLTALLHRFRAGLPAARVETTFRDRQTSREDAGQNQRSMLLAGSIDGLR